MCKIRYYLVTIALMASLGGFAFVKSALPVNPASSHSVSTVSVSSMTGTSATGSVVLIPRPPCGAGGGYDC